MFYGTLVALTLSLAAVASAALVDVPQPRIDFQLRNLTGYEVSNIQFRRPGVNAWSENILRGGRIAPNGTLRIVLPHPRYCDFDMKTLVSGFSIEYERQHLCGIATYSLKLPSGFKIKDEDPIFRSKVWDKFGTPKPTPAPTRYGNGLGPAFSIENDSDGLIIELYVVPSGSRAWDDNLIANSGPLKPHQGLNFEEKKPGCLFDVRVVALKHGARTSEEARNLDVCKNKRIRYR